MTTTEARVELLTAEVRTLVVGARQVTLSVARQLDIVPPWYGVEPFGRVRIGGSMLGYSPEQIGVQIIGKYDGRLVRAFLLRTGTSAERERHSLPGYPQGDICRCGAPTVNDQGCSEGIRLFLAHYENDRWGHGDWEPTNWYALPLIVLAGLR